MVSIKFVAQDCKTKECTNSTPVFFETIGELERELIELNRKKIQTAMPFCRVFAIIIQEEIDK